MGIYRNGDFDFTSTQNFQKFSFTYQTKANKIIESDYIFYFVVID